MTMTMLMQNFGATNKEYYGMLWYFLEWEGNWSRKRVPQLFLGSFLGTCRSAIGLQKHSQKSLQRLTRPSLFLVSKVVNSSLLCLASFTVQSS